MDIIAKRGDESVATAYLADLGDGRYVEFVESLGGSAGRDEKWVLILSSLSGCPIQCRFCDANSFYEGKLSTEEMMEQVEFLIGEKGREEWVHSDKFKVQFARIGEPSLNKNVIDAIEEIDRRYEPENYMPCISTIAPSGRGAWFEMLKRLNHDRFHGEFQLQFSVHSTDKKIRDHLIPTDKWSLERISGYGEEFYVGGRKVTLNFAISREDQLDVDKLEDIFSPETFAVKVTPLNPTANAEENELVNVFTEENASRYETIQRLEDSPFDLYLSIGDLKENEIRSNCGQILMSHLDPGGTSGDR